MSKRLIAYQAFAEVAASGSFSRAAERLRLSASQVSRLIAGLEQRIGATLLQRTTRTVSLTDAGRIFLMQITSALQQLAEAEAMVGGGSPEMTGRLRVSVPTVLGTGIVASASAAFMAQHPGLSVVLTLIDRLVEPLSEGYDVVIRAGEPSDDDGIWRLGLMSLGLCASPAYLAQHGRPRTPDELTAHRLIQFEPSGRSRQPWRLRDGYGERLINIDPILSTNNADVARHAAVRGVGISQLPAFFMAEDIARGTLVSLLDGFEPKPLVIEAARSAFADRSQVSLRYLAALETALKRLPT